LKNTLIIRGEDMNNKYKVTKKQMAALGIRKTETGDYDYIDPREKGKSKYEPISKREVSK
jgi:hypothetical protein